MRVPEAVVFERDNRAFELRKAGMSYRQIAKALDVSEFTAHTAVRRVMERIGKRMAEDHTDVVLMELQRLDAIMQNLWGMTMPHRVKAEDGVTDIVLPPNMEAIDRVLKIMDRRAKLLGLDSVTLNVGRPAEGPSLGTGDSTAGEVTPEMEARKLLRIMSETGVLDQSAVRSIRQAMGEDVIEAVAVEESRELPQQAIAASPDDGLGEEDIPHEWADDEDA